MDSLKTPLRLVTGDMDAGNGMMSFVRIEDAGGEEIVFGWNEEYCLNTFNYIVTACNAHDTLVAALLQAESALHARLPNSTAMTEVLAALKSIGIEPQRKSASLPGL